MVPVVPRLTRYVKVTFFRGTSLQPVPPGPSKGKDTRYMDIHEGDELDEAQMATWVKQAAALPGWVPSRPSWESVLPQTSLKPTAAASSPCAARWRRVQKRP